MFGDELLNGKQLAEKLGISVSYLHTLVQAGLPYRELANSHKYFVLDDVKKWIMCGGQSASHDGKIRAVKLVPSYKEELK
ncbi:hypothetical protein [Ligilactobacillus sp. LYQ60]|uniref:hypothetical protein n=1 Tax=unclassified Ligilactobacillus TaxID=2767920 RepID=UPI00385523B6